jgi:hypothetical protein
VKHVIRPLRGRWCDIIVLKVHAPTKDKIDDTRTASAKNWNVYSIYSLKTVSKFCQEISMPK